jgi:uncharacterized glyoxalase superfamily protein PhnB
LLIDTLTGFYFHLRGPPVKIYPPGITGKWDWENNYLVAGEKASSDITQTLLDMYLKQIIPLLWVDDVRATIDYYVATYGFDEANYREDLGWGVVEKHDIQIMFSRPIANMPYERPIFTGSLYLRTDGVDAWWSFLKDRATIVYPVENFEYGMREFAIRDCNGYILQIGEAIE